MVFLHDILQKEKQIRNLLSIADTQIELLSCTGDSKSPPMFKELGPKGTQFQTWRRTVNNATSSTKGPKKKRGMSGTIVRYGHLVEISVVEEQIR
jgi:hypothetical protein